MKEKCQEASDPFTSNESGHIFIALLFHLYEEKDYEPKLEGEHPENGTFTSE